MAIREFELFHGAVLAKLLRSERPVSLRLIETKPTQSWSTYTLNDQVDLFISHSRSPRALSDGGTSWQFVFSANQLRQMNSQVRGRPVHVALVCLAREPAKGKSLVCLLNPDEVENLIDFTQVPQSVTVRKPASRGQFRVYKDRRVFRRVPLSRLEEWQIPGS